MEGSGRYRLTRRLGQGGMAEVLEGVSEGEGGFRRRVAVKRILPHLSADAAVARMFLDEARIASHLHHANVVAVLDYGTLDGVPFQVLEFVDGLDLERIARLCEERGARLPTGLALHVVTQVAYALDHAHRARDEAGAPLEIVHRDVSPANVLVSWDGHVKLGDFGIALAAGRLEKTQNDGIKGKLEYMSPEQATRGTVDARTDVFALGCTLHRLLAGESPLADLGALTRLIAGEELTLAPELDPAIAVIIRKATRASRVERHGSAAELAAELGALVSAHVQGEPTGALRAFLASLREPNEAPKPKRGALDALLDVELLLSGEGDQRAYVTRQSQSPTKVNTSVSGPAREQGAVAHAETALASTPAAPRPRRTLSFALAAAALAAVLALGLARDRASSATPAKAPAPAPVAPAAPRQEPAQAVEGPRAAPAAEPASVRSAPDGVTPAEPALTPAEPAQVGLRAGRKSRAPRRVDTASPPTPRAPDEPATGRGTLVIGGLRAHRAEIRVDGRSEGFAPKRLELPTGSHELLLIAPDGTRIGPRIIEVSARNTPSAPAKWLVE